MALERIGLGGVLEFDSKRAVTNMGRAQKAAQRFGATFGKLKGKISKVGAAVSNMGQAMRTGGLAMLPMTATLGLGIKKAADFEQQMSAVSAITRATAPDFERLKLKAKAMGATTVFSATQSAQAMEAMGRAGFTTNEIIVGLSGVMAVAAADSIELASAASIVSNVIKGMGLEATDTERVADILALTSAKTNTDVTSLGEAFKFAGAQAKTMGIDLETTAAILGVTADAGLRGTLAGTSFTNMLVKLSKPSKKAIGLMEQLGVSLTSNADGSLNIVKSMGDFSAALNRVHDRTKRAAAASEIFGVRGQKAFSAISQAIKTGKLDEMVVALQTAEGAAARMAAVRLDNFKGAITLLTSAMEGFAIETTGLFLGPLAGGTKSFTKGLSLTVQVLQEMNSELGLTKTTSQAAGSTIVAIAAGIKEGIELVISAGSRARQMFTQLLSAFGVQAGAEMTQTITKIITVIAIVGAILAPILLVFGGIVFFITSVLVPAITSIGTVFGLVFSGPVLLAIGVGLAAWFLLKDEIGEFVSFIQEVGGSIVALFNTLVEAAIMPFANSFGEIVMPALVELGRVIGDTVHFATETFSGLFEFIRQAIEITQPIWESAFSGFGAIAGFAVKGVIFLFKSLLRIIQFVIGTIKSLIVFITEGVVGAMQGMARMVLSLSDALGLDVNVRFRQFAEAPNFSFQNLESAGRVDLSDDAPTIAKDVTDTRANLAKKVTDTAAKAKKRAARPQNLQANIKLEDKRKTEIKSKLCINGKEMAVALSDVKQEVSERSGFKATPWQRRIMLEQGAAPVGGVGGG